MALPFELKNKEQRAKHKKLTQGEIAKISAWFVINGAKIKKDRPTQPEVIKMIAKDLEIHMSAHQLSYLCKNIGFSWPRGKGAKKKAKKKDTLIGSNIAKELTRQNANRVREIENLRERIIRLEAFQNRVSEAFGDEVQ